MNNNKIVKDYITIRRKLNDIYLIIKNKLVRYFFRFNSLQLIIISSIIIGLIIYFSKNIFNNYLNSLIIKPNVRLLELKEGIPFLAYLKKDTNNSYINFYKQYLSRYYNKYIEGINNSILNIVSNDTLNSTIPNVDTYNFWIYISSNNSGLTKYFLNNGFIRNRKENYNIGNLFTTLNNNYKKLIFTRSNGVYEYPTLYLIKNELYLYVKITNKSSSDDSNENDYDISLNTNIKFDLNTWNNINISINNNIITLYKNGRLEQTYTIKMDNKTLVNNMNFPIYLLNHNVLNDSIIMKYKDTIGTFEKPYNLGECITNGSCLQNNNLLKYKYYSFNSMKYYILNNINCKSNSCIEDSDCNDYIKVNNENISIINKETLNNDFYGFEGYLNEFKYYNNVFSPGEIYNIYLDELNSIFMKLDNDVNKYINSENYDLTIENKKIEDMEREKLEIINKNNETELKNLNKMKILNRFLN